MPHNFFLTHNFIGKSSIKNKSYGFWKIYFVIWYSTIICSFDFIKKNTLFFIIRISKKKKSVSQHTSFCMKMYDFEMWKIGKKTQQTPDLLHKLLQFASFTINYTFTTSSLILFCLVPMFHIRCLIKNFLISKLLFSLFCLALPVYITVFFLFCVFQPLWILQVHA